MTDPMSSAEYQHNRGVAWDIIDQAINTYDVWMLDDDYDAMTTLHLIISRMKKRRSYYLPADPR